MTEREKYLLICLMEEAAEIQMACSKALRHGLNSLYPNKPSTNSEDISREVADLLGLVDLLVDDKTIQRPHNSHIENKKIKLTGILKEKGI